MLTPMQLFLLSIRHTMCCVFLMAIPLLTATQSESHEVSSPAGSSMREGALAFERGAFSTALSHWKQAAELYKSSGNTPAQVEALVLSSQASLGLGQSKQALQSLELALGLAQKSGDPLVEAPILGHLGRTYLTMRQLPQASEFLRQASALGRKQNSSPLLATTLNDLGILLVLQQQDQNALDTFQESVTHAQSVGLPLLAATARTNAARAWLRLKQATNSRLTLDAALEQLQEVTPPSRQTALGLIGIAVTYQRLLPHLPKNMMRSCCARLAHSRNPLPSQSAWATNGRSPMPWGTLGSCMKPHFVWMKRYNSPGERYSPRNRWMRRSHSIAGNGNSAVSWRRSDNLTRRSPHTGRRH